MTTNLKSLHYHVQNPWTDESEQKRFPLTEVRIEEVPGMTVTKTRKPGWAVRATIKAWNGKTLEGLAVWTPEPGVDYKFKKGAKIALQRALEQTDVVNFTKETRKSIWAGFFMLTEKDQHRLMIELSDRKD